MPATPAWPPLSAPRLFVDSDLSSTASLTIDGAQAHYLVNVMRVKAGDAIKLFDDISGEYAARVVATGRRDLSLAIESKLRTREPVPDLWLCAAPIKRARFDSMAEKACELGVARFVPVATARAVVDKIKPDRLRARMIEAAEQCERTALPALDDLTKLDALLAGWPAGANTVLRRRTRRCELCRRPRRPSRPRGDPDRPRRWLYRRRERRDPCLFGSSADLARPAHPARRNRRDRRDRSMDGARRRLVSPPVLAREWGWSSPVAHPKASP